MDNTKRIDKLLLLTDAQIVNIYNAICSDNPYIYESYHDGILDFIPTCDEIRYVYEKRILFNTDRYYVEGDIVLDKYKFYESVTSSDLDTDKDYESVSCEDEELISLLRLPRGTEFIICINGTHKGAKLSKVYLDGRLEFDVTIQHSIYYKDTENYRMIKR